MHSRSSQHSSFFQDTRNLCLNSPNSLDIYGSPHGMLITPNFATATMRFSASRPLPETQRTAQRLAGFPGGMVNISFSPNATSTTLKGKQKIASQFRIFAGFALFPFRLNCTLIWLLMSLYILHLYTGNSNMTQKSPSPKKTGVRFDLAVEVRVNQSLPVTPSDMPRGFQGLQTIYLHRR